MNRLTLEHVTSLLCGSELSITPFHALVLSSTPGGITMTEAAHECRLTTAALTCHADRLERLGLVERVRVSSDRRKIYLCATQKGLEMVDDFRDRLKKMQGLL